MAHVRQVKPHDAACAVDVLRVVHNEICIQCQVYRATRVLGQHRTLVRRSACVAVSEVVTLACRDSYFAVIRAKFVAEVGRKAVLSVCAAHILTVKQGEAVLNGEGAVGVPAALQRVQVVVVIGRSVSTRHAIRERFDILIDTVLVVDALAPVAHLLLVEHFQHIFQRHGRAQLVGHLAQLVGAASHQLPQYRVMPCKGIRADALVHRLPRYRVVVLQHRVIPLAEDGIHVVGNEVPYLAVPCHEHHVLRAVIDSHQVVGYQIPCKGRVVAEIALIFVQELCRVALARINPFPKAFHSCLVVLVRRRPCVIGLETELQCVVKRVHVARTEQTQCLRVVQKLQTDALVAFTIECCFVIETLDTLKAVDDAAAALLVQEVVLA